MDRFGSKQTDSHASSLLEDSEPPIILIMSSEHLGNNHAYSHGSPDSAEAFHGISSPVSGPLDFRLASVNLSQLPKSFTFEVANVSYIIFIRKINIPSSSSSVFSHLFKAYMYKIIIFTWLRLLGRDLGPHWQQQWRQQCKSSSHNHGRKEGFCELAPLGPMVGGWLAHQSLELDSGICTNINSCQLAQKLPKHRVHTLSVSYYKIKVYMWTLWESMLGNHHNPFKSLESHLLKTTSAL